MEASEPNRRPGWAIAAGVLLSLAGLAAVPASTAVNHEVFAEEACIPHPTIEITERVGPQGFEWVDPATGEREHRPGSGVVAGSGTAEDPYVIEGWCITYADDGFRVDGEQVYEYTDRGITIEGTDAHVEIRDNVVGMAPLGKAAVAIEDAANVAIQDNEVRPIHPYDDDLGYGVFVQGSEDIAIAGNDVLRAGEAGILVNVASSIAIEDNTLEGGVEYGIFTDDVSDLLVEGNFVLDHVKTGIELEDIVDGLVQRNLVEDNAFGLDIDGGHENVVQRNRVDANGLGVAVHDGADGTLLAHNEIFDNDDGVWLHEASAPEVEANAIVGNDRGVFAHAAQDAHVHGNNIDESTDVGLTTEGSVDTVDATDNWWGCPDGPADPACDDAEGDVLVDPWLSEPNPDVGTGLAWPSDPGVAP